MDKFTVQATPYKGYAIVQHAATNKYTVAKLDNYYSCLGRPFDNPEEAKDYIETLPKIIPQVSFKELQKKILEHLKDAYISSASKTSILYTQDELHLAFSVFFSTVVSHDESYLFKQDDTQDEFIIKCDQLLTKYNFNTFFKEHIGQPLGRVGILLNTMALLAYRRYYQTSKSNNL